MSTTHVPGVGRGNLIDGVFQRVSGTLLKSVNPARKAEVVWQQEVNTSAVAPAVEAARQAFVPWRKLGVAARAELLAKLKEEIGKDAEPLAQLIAIEAGKPLWEARTEVAALRGKIDITLAEGRADIAGHTLPDKSFVRHHPHGVFAVLGPFNFPLSLSHGHIVPLLLAGNTVVLKPSEQTPAVAERYADLFVRAGFPRGVMNLVQGAGDVGQWLSSHKDVSGIAFTGSYKVGRALTLAALDQPHKILALEMGGKNATIVHSDANFDLALYESVFSAFVTAGQRCTATSRLILVDNGQGFADRFTEALVSHAARLAVGDPLQPTTFMGPLVSENSKRSFGEATAALSKEAEVLLKAEQQSFFDDGFFVAPHIVRPASTARSPLFKEEIFGPSLTIEVVRDEEEAIVAANDIEYGLALSVFTQDEARFERQLELSRAGIVNWNKGTVGATGKLPFGGIGKSGNFRPAGVYSGRYATYPVATVVGGAIPPGDQQPPGFAFVSAKAGEAKS